VYAQAPVPATSKIKYKMVKSCIPLPFLENVSKNTEMDRFRKKQV
jgi:hypothetical protein